MSKFVIDILDMYWINGKRDDQNDLCLHGKVYLKIGDEVLADIYECNISSAALYLLKSIELNHIAGKMSNQLIPHCGHFIMPDNESDTVEIMGCIYGVDWSVLHSDDNVKLVTEKGSEVTISSDKYKEIIYGFVDKVEEFYKKCQPKLPPTDNYEREGYDKFWKEWERRKNGGLKKGTC